MVFSVYGVCLQSTRRAICCFHWDVSLTARLWAKPTTAVRRCLVCGLIFLDAILAVRDAQYAWNAAFALGILEPVASAKTTRQSARALSGPFYSSFVLGICFFLCVLAIYHIVKEVRARSFHRLFWVAFIGQTLLYLLIEYRLVYSLLWESEPTSREDFEEGRNGLPATMRLVLKHLVLGHTHDRAAQAPILLLTIGVVVILSWRQNGQLPRRIRRLTYLLIGLSIWYAVGFI